MGNRNFYNIMINDTLQQHNKIKIADLDYVVSLKEHMQVINSIPSVLIVNLKQK